jgi:hypothetical protein
MRDYTTALDAFETRQLALRAESRMAIPTPRDPRMDDLRKVIHILAMALTDGKAAS